MRRRFLLLSASCFVASACKTEVVDTSAKQEASERSRSDDAPVDVQCKPGHALDRATFEAVASEAGRVYADVAGGRSSAVWDNLHPQARRDDQKQAFMDALQSMQARLHLATGEPRIAALHVIEAGGVAEASPGVACEGTDLLEGFTWTSPVDADLALVTFLTPGNEFGLATTLQLRKAGDVWRLVGAQANPASYEGRNAAHWERIADDYWRADKPMPSYLALGVAQTLSTRGGSVKTETKDRINEKLEDIRADKGFAEDTSHWVIEGQRFELVGVSLASTLTEISPVIKYVSPRGLEREVLERQADTLVAHLRGLHPELKALFETVWFEAYAEPPSNPGESYEAHRIPRFLDPDRPQPAG